MQFETTIHQEPGKNHAGIPVPDEVVDALGAGKRALVVVTVGGGVEEGRQAHEHGRQPDEGVQHRCDQDGTLRADARSGSRMGVWGSCPGSP